MFMIVVVLYNGLLNLKSVGLKTYIKIHIKLHINLGVRGEYVHQDNLSSKAHFPRKFCSAKQDVLYNPGPHFCL